MSTAPDPLHPESAGSDSPDASQPSAAPPEASAPDADASAEIVRTPEPLPGAAEAVDQLLAEVTAAADASDPPAAHAEVSAPYASDAPTTDDAGPSADESAAHAGAPPSAEVETAEPTAAEAAEETVVEAPAVQPSPHQGMGAVPHATGVSFRVWAPHADAVSVAGAFNDFQAAAHPLAREEGGLWSADIAEAKVGDEYRFVIRSGEQVLERSDPYARDLVSSVGNSVVTDPAFDWGDDGGYRTPPWNELVIYELHVGTFNDRAGGAPGTFQGVIDRLDYLRDLGINAIEVMPAAEFAGDWSWGYNPAYIYAVESAFGGPAELKRLVKEAHARGIAVILDVVYNHLGPSDLDLWQFDGWSEDGKGGIYFYNDRRSHTPWGDTRPDYGREEVRSYLAENARMWLEEFRIDGLRWDATAYIRNIYGNNDNQASDLADGWSLMQRINAESDARQPWKLQIAEDLRGNAWITRDAETGGAGFDTQWDGEFVHPLRRAVIAPWDDSRSMDEVRRAIEHAYNGDPLQRVIYTESHDEVANGRARVPHEIDPDDPGSWFARKRSTLGAAAVFTSPGIPMLFQGQEILEDEWFRDEDPVDWGKLERFAGVHLLYGDLARLRRNWFDHTRGLRGPHVRVHHVNEADKVIAFHRWENGGPRDDVVVVLNFGNRAYGEYVIGFPRGGEWKVRLNSDWEGYGPDYGGHPSWHLRAQAAPRDGLPCSGAVGLGPYTALILSQDE